MANSIKVDLEIIFVDCFDTLILRKEKTNQIFKNWACQLSSQFDINWKILYKTYKKINFCECIKKFFTNFIFQESFDVVVSKMYSKLSKKYKTLNKEQFVSSAVDLYIKEEMKTHYVNESFINLLKAEKLKGKKLYIVSDFYLSSNILKKWIENLKIENLFDDIYSSCDYNKEKSTAKLYKHLLRQLNLNPKQVLMIGDNVWSDIFMARLCGLNAQKIKHRR